MNDRSRPGRCTHRGLPPRRTFLLIGLRWSINSHGSTAGGCDSSGWLVVACLTHSWVRCRSWQATPSCAMTCCNADSLTARPVDE